MKISEYSVRVLNQNNSPTVETGVGYCYLKHQEQYKLALKNYSENDASAEVSIDGKVVGIYLVKSKSKVIVEGPLNSDACFTFYKFDSEQGQNLSEDTDPQNYGLVQVKFLAIKPNTKEEEKTLIIEHHYHNYHTWWLDYYYKPYWRPGDVPNVTPLWLYQPNNAPVYINSTGYSDINVGSGSFLNTTQVVASAGVTGLTGYSDKDYETPEKDSIFIRGSLTTISLRLVISDEKEEPKKIVGLSNPIPPSIF